MANILQGLPISRILKRRLTMALIVFYYAATSLSTILFIINPYKLGLAVLRALD